MWKNLDEFSGWYVDNQHPLKPPADEPVYDTGYSLRYVIFRENRFQVEMCIVKPNSVFTNYVPKSGVDHCTLFLSGTFIGYKYDDIVLDTSSLGKHADGTSIFLNQIFKESQFDLDKLTTGGQGAAFMSLQHWEDNSTMTSLAKFNNII
jgi:hypothetical protein